MQQIRFYRCTDENLLDVQEEINKWLRESGARVIQISGNLAAPAVVSQAATRGLGGVAGRFAHSDILLAVLYEEAG